MKPLTSVPDFASCLTNVLEFTSPSRFTLTTTNCYLTSAGLCIVSIFLVEVGRSAGFRISDYLLMNLVLSCFIDQSELGKNQWYTAKIITYLNNYKIWTKVFSYHTIFHTNRFSEDTQVYTDTFLLLKSILFLISACLQFVSEMVSFNKLLRISSPSKWFKVCVAFFLIIHYSSDQQ